MDQDQDFYLLNGAYGDESNHLNGQIFDDFTNGSPTVPADSDTPAGFLNPSKLDRSQESNIKSETSFSQSRFQHQYRSGSASSSSPGSSTDSPKYPDESHNYSVDSNNTEAVMNKQRTNWASGVTGLPLSSGDDLVGDSNMMGMDQGYSVNTDYEASNRQMASDFDFETAGSTPSGFMQGANKINGQLGNVTGLHLSQSFGNFGHAKNPPPTKFFFGESRESSPLSAVLPTNQQAFAKQSPSSGLEETFNEMGMHNRDSPGDGSFTPNLQFPNSQFTFDNTKSSTPSFGKAMSSPPPNLNSGDPSRPAIYLLHKSFKSRVETQIPIRLILSPLPAGIKKLRLPPYTVAKPKFYAKSEVERSPDTYELLTSLVCTSAMQDPKKHDRALARARGDDVRFPSRPSPASSSDSYSSKEEEDKPLNGGEVRICSGCIARERKRNSRKKTKKPDEEELFQKDEEKRVIVFNTNEVKDWHEPSFEEDDPKTGRRITVPSPHFMPGSMQVDLPMRIACYCRHQHEKLGFIVIFTIKDCNNTVVAQGETQSIMITDDHKTNNMPPQIPAPASGMPPNSQFPGSGVFPASALERPGGSTMGPRPFRTSLSTTDLSGLQSNFDPQYPMSASSSNPFAIPNPVSVATSATLTPKNLSRPPSPNGVPGPNTKRRKHSGSGKVPTNLTMTRLETSQPAPVSNAIANPPLTSPYTPQGPSYPPDRGFAVPAPRSNQVTTSPPTPNSNSDFGFMTAVNRSFSMENLPRQAMMSAPSSRQPSRPGSPISNRNSFNQAEAAVAHAMAPQPYSQSRRPMPLIHKLIPTEGSVTGGTEVSLLGNGFYQGLEVMFGDTEATTTTFWGDKCLTCLTPPALQPGTVAVVFKHEHPIYSQRPRQPQQRTPVFNYTDDSENEMLRLALRALGPNLPQPTADPMAAAQQLLGGPSAPGWLMQGNYSGGPHQQASSGRAAEMVELESNMLRFLDALDTLTKFRPRLDLSSPTGQTLLHLASYLGLTRLVVGLLTRGADLNAMDKNGNTPMHLAVLNGHPHIVHRLRLAGADNRIRSLRNYLPADMASTLQARQAAVLPPHYYRTRSAGGTPMQLQSRNTSLTSLTSLTDSHTTGNTVEDSSDFSDRELAPETISLPFRPAIGSQRPSRRPSFHDFRRVTSSSTQSRRSSGNELSIQRMLPNPATIDDASALVSPAAYMMAWRDQLAAQIHQYQQNAHRFLPNLPTLPTLPQLPQLPGLPDYQTNPMVRRVSSLFPQRAPSRPPTAQGSKESWWESFTGSPLASAAPPAYEDLYPNHETEEDISLKKESSIRALADAALDQHFESSSSTQIAQARSRPSDASRRLQQQARTQFEGREVKPLRKDSTLHFFWIPLLVVVLTLSLRGIIPDLSHAVSRGYQYLSEHYAQQGAVHAS